jgi:hypothetical protein
MKNLSWDTKSTVPSNRLSASSSTSFESRSRWFVGSSSTRRLAGCRSILRRASLERSPPDSTRTGFSTSSPRNRKAPRRLRTPGRRLVGQAAAASSSTVLDSSSESATSWEK